MPSDEEEKEAEALEAVMDVHEALAKCMRPYCSEPRCVLPGKGESVLCREHSDEVLRGEAKPPPLRPCIDYQPFARKTFLVEDLPGPKR